MPPPYRRDNYAHSKKQWQTKGAHKLSLCAYLCSEVRQKPSAALFMEFSKCTASNNVLYIALTFTEALKLALWHKTVIWWSHMREHKSSLWVSTAQEMFVMWSSSAVFTRRTQAHCPNWIWINILCWGLLKKHGINDFSYNSVLIVDAYG